MLKDCSLFYGFRSCCLEFAYPCLLMWNQRKKFSSKRAGFFDFGIGIIFCWMFHRNNIWAGLLLYFCVISFIFWFSMFPLNNGPKPWLLYCFLYRMKASLHHASVVYVRSDLSLVLWYSGIINVGVVLFQSCILL